ncbi:serine hydrolase [Dyella sp. 20L07]|uniref:serine hydrolase n=1 Tax=Dyella sp. 20L07 TaxID=3384240 RepID=UPI003D29A5C6
MKARRIALLSALLFAVDIQGHATTLVADKQQQVDALFAKWNRADTPGVAVEVVQDGKVVYRRAFGMADIEQGRQITPSTPFHVASLSKQFTAFAVLLLVQDGRLSLDDDVHRYLPELPDFGHVIQIRHLLNHTSGLRDQWNLLAMAGWRMEDVITNDDVMGLVRRQRSLNFEPGTEFEYCNTGYTLLGLIVERVSGKSLAAFSKERIFDPLGMKHTFFHEQYATLVAGRAQSYQPSPGTGYEGVALSYSTVGPSSLFTTADDLVLWERNFDDARVGGKPLLAQMQTPATLNDGTALDYGDGLFVGSYRGLKSIDHDGADAGFRSYLLRFPDQHLAIVIVGNGADVQANRLGERIADIYLDGKLGALPMSVPDYANSTEVPIEPAELDALVGTYRLENGSAITFAKEDGHLVGWTAGDDKMSFYPASEHEFFVKVANARFTFDPPGANGVVAGGTWRRNTRTKRATRVEPEKLPGNELKALEGEYYSDELHVLYTVMAKGGSVVLRYSRGDIALAPFGKDSFVGPWPFGLVHFQCTSSSECAGFTATEDRARDVQFTKLPLNPQG